eukprot:scaffold952_cov409-Prasinococcus_capsulatus_cf.AAC.23
MSCAHVNSVHLPPMSPPQATMLLLYLDSRTLGLTEALGVGCLGLLYADSGDSFVLVGHGPRR